MSKIPIPVASAKNSAATPRYNKCFNDKEKSSIKYPKLDLTKVSRCTYCKNYVDLTCEGWNQDTLSGYGKLNEQQASRLKYTCNHCNTTNGKLVAYGSDITRINEEIARYRNEVDKYKTESYIATKMKLECLSKKLSVMQSVLVKKKDLDQYILELNDKLHDLVKRVSSTNSFLAEPLSHQQDEREYQNQYNRKNRVVIIGVPKEVSDDDFIMELNKELKLDLDKNKIIKMFRINAKNIPSHKTPPLNIEFRNFSDKLKILNHIKEKVYSLPNHSKFKNVQIFPNRTLNRGSSLKL